jgi:hypothetical protein
MYGVFFLSLTDAKKTSFSAHKELMTKWPHHKSSLPLCNYPTSNVPETKDDRECTGRKRRGRLDTFTGDIF